VIGAGDREVLPWVPATRYLPLPKLAALNGGTADSQAASMGQHPTTAPLKLAVGQSRALQRGV